MTSALRAELRATDPVALAVQSHARSLQNDGYGELGMRVDRGEVVVSFGPIEVRGENCDVALVRLATALLDHAALSGPFLGYMRDAVKQLPALRRRENRVTTRPGADRR